MGIFDEWGHFGERKDDKRTWSEKIAGTRNNKTAIKKTSNVNPGIMDNGLNKPPVQSDSQPRYANKQQFDEANYKEPPPPSFMDQLMERISAQYEPIMPTAPQGPNPNDAIMARITEQLDQALAGRLGAIGNVRNQAQQGYDTSDRNLAAMFGANANHIATQGSQRYGQIADEHKAALTGLRDDSVNKLAADRSNAMAERAAMLQRLGIEAAGAQADPGEETLNNAITDVTKRSATALQGAESMGANNQAFNQSVVNSVNQQGTERRAALLQQLQSIQNELGMAEAEAQGQNAQAKSQLEIQRMQAQAQNQPDYNAMNKFGYQQFRDNRDLAFDLYKSMIGQEGKAAEPQKVQGMAGVSQDLLNQGVPAEQASQWINALSQVVSGEYMQGIHPDDGYDRASIIARRLKEEMQVPDPWATHIATNYANIGNNAYYTAQ